MHKEKTPLSKVSPILVMDTKGSRAGFLSLSLSFSLSLSLSLSFPFFFTYFIIIFILLLSLLLLLLLLFYYRWGVAKLLLEQRKGSHCRCVCVGYLMMTNMAVIVQSQAWRPGQ